MKLQHRFYILLLQIALVGVGLYLYHLYLGGTGIAVGDAITWWATLITIVFIVFSVIGIMNIEGKIKDLEETRQQQAAKYQEVENSSEELIRSIKDAKKQIVEEAEKEIKKIINNTTQRQNYYQVLSQYDADPAPDRRISYYTDLMANTPPMEGVDKGYLYVKRGTAYMQMGLFEKAKTDFEMAVMHCAENNQAAAHSALATYYIEKKQYEKSIEEFKKALEHGETSQLYMDIANSYNKIGKFMEAEEYYNKALAMNPDLAEAYYNISLRLKDQLKDAASYTEIIGYLDKCLSLNPLFIPAHINKAAALRGQGKELEAVEELNKVTEKIYTPDFLMAVEQRGIAYRITMNLPKALNDFNFVLLFAPHNVQNLCNLALTYMGLQNLREADYYSRIGLEEANRQNMHDCDGEMMTVQQTIVAYRTQQMKAAYSAQQQQNK